MGIRKILTDKDPALHKVCKPVEVFDKKLHKLLDDMAQTLEEANGVGLAAPQVGILRRVVIVDIGEEILELVNPTLVETSGEQTGAEGGLSVRSGDPSQQGQGPGPGPGRQLVRGRGRGTDRPVLLPRAGPFGRHFVYPGHGPVPHRGGAGRTLMHPLRGWMQNA